MLNRNNFPVTGCYRHVAQFIWKIYWKSISVCGLCNGLMMSTHIAESVVGWFAMRQLRSIRRCCARLVVSLVLTRLDYCNTLLAACRPVSCSTDYNRSSTVLFASSSHDAKVTKSLHSSWITRHVTEDRVQTVRWRIGLPLRQR